MACTHTVLRSFPTNFTDVLVLLLRAITFFLVFSLVLAEGLVESHLSSLNFAASPD